jgi:DNA-binding MarR family transcriptional regulator
MKIEEEIKQGSFPSEQERLMINIMYTGNQFTLRGNRDLKPFDLTTQQFNVLRILRGQKGCPLSVKEMEGRMLDRSSNISRLVDKLLKKSLIERLVCEEDRRRVDLSITAKGMDLLAQIDEVHKEMKSALKEVLTEEEALMANSILDKLRTINQI